MEGFEVLYVLLELLYGQILANAIAILMVVLCWRWKAAGRLSFVLLFLWAGQYNLREAFLRPEQYLEYARLASFRSISRNSSWGSSLSIRQLSWLPLVWASSPRPFSCHCVALPSVWGWWAPSSVSSLSHPWDLVQHFHQH